MKLLNNKALKRKNLVLFLFCVVFFLTQVKSFASLDILLPTENQKIILPEVPVKGKVTSIKGFIGKIEWETTVENKSYATFTHSDEQGKIIILPFPSHNSSFGSNIVKATAKIDTTPPEITLKQPQKIIFVPQSQWPKDANGRPSYKIPISYPVNISCNVKDNFAVNDIRISVDEKLIYTQYNISISTFIPFVEVFTSTLCGWNKHTLTITATDLAGNMNV